MQDPLTPSENPPFLPSQILAEGILNAVETLVVVVDGQGRILYVNPAVSHILGYQPEEVLGEGWWEKAFRLEPEVGKAVRERLSRAARGDASALQGPHARRLYSAGGEERWIVFSDAKGPGDLMIGVGQDVTRLRTIEELNRRHEQEFSAVFENSSDGMLILNSDWVYEQANEAASRILGLTSQEIIGKKFGEVVPVSVDVFEFRERGERDGFSTVELTVQREDAAFRELKVSLRTNFRPGYHLIVQRDVTDERLLQKQLAEAHRLESIGRLAGGVAHDFNNMLTAIVGYGELLQRSVTEEKHKKFVKMILGATSQATKTTQRLLAFSRKQMLEPQVVDLNQAISEALELLQRVIGEDIEVVLLLAPDAGKVLVDPAQFGQVLTNLVLNSRHAMPEGGKLIIESHRFEVSKDYTSKHIQVRPGQYSMVAITDTGTGIPQEIKAHIFEPFFTTKEQGKGTGLGLATVYGVVKQSGGEIWVYSEPGQGSTFKIYLPRIENEAGVETGPKKATILVIEDDEMMRLVTVQALEQDGYRVLSAADGTEALALCQQWPQTIDLVLTDVMVNGITGQDLMGYFAVKYPSLAVVHMSGFARARLEYANTIFSDALFLAKPFTINQLLDIIQLALQQKTARDSGLNYDPHSEA
jgi:PAS domain S-box-containing protein